MNILNELIYFFLVLSEKEKSTFNDRMRNELNEAKTNFIENWTPSWQSAVVSTHMQSACSI